MKQIHSLALCASAAVLLLTGCSTTRFTTTWKAPDADLTHLLPGSKVGALVMYPQVPVRRAAEDALASELTRRGLQGVAAYAVLGETDVQNEAAVKEAFAKSGAVAVVVMRGIGTETEVDYVSPTYQTMPANNGFWGGYYGMGWHTVMDPGYLRTSKVVTVETLVYDLKTNKLVWGGQSRTTDPAMLSSFISEVVEEAVKEMKKDGVL